MENYISLNGEWNIDYFSGEQYRESAEPGFVSGTSAVCPVPGYWEDLSDLFEKAGMTPRIATNPGYVRQSYPQTGYVRDTEFPNPVGCFIYKRTFDIQEEQPNTDALLWFGGVQNAVSAWINGLFIGRHEGYSAPFYFDVPHTALKTGLNTITLAVSNNRLAGYAGKPVSGVTSRAVCECSGGIYGDVSIMFVPDGLKGVRVLTEKDLGSFTVTVEGAVDCVKKITVSDGENAVRRGEIPPGCNVIRMKSDGLETWSPDSPKLYRLTVNTDNQEISVRFGIRRLTADGKRLMLNGKPFYFRGACEHFYQPKTLHPTRNVDYYFGVIRELKKYGFNSIRFHTWIPTEEYLIAADELGMVIEAESPNNTSVEEWEDIVRFCVNHPSVCIYSTGNELMIDDDYEKHLRECASIVHNVTDALFSPMSAMRCVEYYLENETSVTEKPFPHNAERLRRISEYCDLYNSFSLGLTSYVSSEGTSEELESNNRVYGKPLLSHEIGIHGTYIDLSLENRYDGTRMAGTGFMSSVREHLEKRGLIDKAPVYLCNSVRWQEILRKQCFENVRACDSFAGYDFLGPIDTHWHTFGYCVGFMNEFYELKPGLTAEEIKQYNSPAVLLAGISKVNYWCGADVSIPLSVSNYSNDITDAKLFVSVLCDCRTVFESENSLGRIPDGGITKLTDIAFRIPDSRRPLTLKIHARISGDGEVCGNSWDIYAFPETEAVTPERMKAIGLEIYNDCSADRLAAELEGGKRVILFGHGPFVGRDVTWQISLAGRTNGHLATVIADHPVMNEFPHEGFCGRQFEPMMKNCSSVLLDGTGLSHSPIIDVASSYKNAHREALLFEYSVSRGRLIVCTLDLEKDDPAAVWLKNRITEYASGDFFVPEQSLDTEKLRELCGDTPHNADINQNEAFNINDITMRGGCME